MSPDRHRPADSGSRRVRLQVHLTEAEHAAIDEYRFAKRLPSLSAAVRQLLMAGLASGTRENGV